MYQYKTLHVTQEGPANALALNKDYSQVVIAGRNVFKVFSIQEDQFTEVCNLRVGKNLNLNFSCNDVAWNAIDDHFLATAATNGAVVLWNLNKTGRSKQEHVFIDHKRTVNKVSFHTTEASWLISGSQDGTMKCFDLRIKEAVKTFLSNTESVRDVQFSPHIPQLFASVSENGNVQLWDIRRADKCQQQFTAHSGPIFACDWHPESAWLATASRDKTIKVWDLSVKPQLEFTIHTIASIGRVKWRPQRKFHIASCALVVDCSINVWDVRRPYIPFAAFNEHKDVATGVAWRGDPDVFLSTSRDCTLYQHAFKDASRPANNANPQGMSLNNKGDILYASKMAVNTSSSVKLHGIMQSRKMSYAGDYFHIASSSLHRFTSNLSKDHNFFYLCAQRYILSGKTLSDMCDHNATVAAELGKPQIAVIWNIIKTLYANDYNIKLNTSAVPRDETTLTNGTVTSNIVLDTLLDSDQRSGDTPRGEYSGGDETLEDDRGDLNQTNTYYDNHFGPFRSEFQLPKGDFYFGENELDIEFDRISNDLRNGLYRSLNSISEQQQQDWTLPSEAFPLRHEIQNRSPPPEQFPNHGSPEIGDETQTVTVEDQPSNSLTVATLPKMSPWDPSNIVVDALKHHASIGDVQTAACVLLVLGERRMCLTSLDEATQEHWLLGYIELLARHRLWNITTQVIKLSWIPSVNQLNQQSTTIHTNCGRCSKPLLRSGWLCDRCHSPENAHCSVCHRVVKGLYVWCQGCSHGGHLAHMQQWIMNNKYCPTGCGHICEYS